MHFKYILLIGVSFMPLFVFAARGPSNLFELIALFIRILGALIPLLIGLALVWFLWGAAKFILNADDKFEREEGSKRMLWGIIALFVMVSVWGLVGILAQTFGVDTILPLFPGRDIPPPPPPKPPYILGA